MNIARYNRAVMAYGPRDITIFQNTGIESGVKYCYDWSKRKLINTTVA